MLKKKIIYVLSAFVMLIVTLSIGVGIYAGYITDKIPENIYLQKENITTVKLGLPVTAVNNNKQINFSRPVTFVADKKGNYKFLVKLFGVFDISTVNVNVVDSDYIYPCGFQIGLYLKTDGILAVNSQSFKNSDGFMCEPCRNIIKSGDYILKINGDEVSSKDDMINIIEKSSGNPVIFTIKRGQQEYDVSIKPEINEDGKYRIGLWVKDDAQGIGTVTYIDDNGDFGALGHGISDETTASILNIKKGKIYKTHIVSIIKGNDGTPGELVGTIDYRNCNIIGNINSNTSNGIFGNIDIENLKSYNMEKLEIGYGYEVTKGPAYIRMYTGNNYKDYEINIESLSYGKSKNMTFTVVSPDLLKLTNGIVQGMSGCPIIQNNKIIGAVTHVFVNDPTKGYGIFIETMLDQK